MVVASGSGAAFADNRAIEPIVVVLAKDDAELL
jgi:hypothetical protein